MNLKSDLESDKSFGSINTNNKDRQKENDLLSFKNVKVRNSEKKLSYGTYSTAEKAKVVSLAPDKRYFCFEFGYFNLCNKPFFSEMFPQLNLIIIFEIEDISLSEEKIVYLSESKSSSTDKAQTFNPLSKQTDNLRSYSFIREVSERDKNIFKLNFKVLSYFNGKLLLLSTASIYIDTLKTDQYFKHKTIVNFETNYCREPLVGKLYLSICTRLDSKPLFVADFKGIKYQKNIVQPINSEFTFSNIADVPFFEFDYLTLAKGHNSESQNKSSGLPNNDLRTMVERFCVATNRYEVNYTFLNLVENAANIKEGDLVNVHTKISSLLDVLANPSFHDKVFLPEFLNKLHVFYYGKNIKNDMKGSQMNTFIQILRMEDKIVSEKIIVNALCQLYRCLLLQEKEKDDYQKYLSIFANSDALVALTELFPKLFHFVNFSMPFFDIVSRLLDANLLEKTNAIV